MRFFRAFLCSVPNGISHGGRARPFPKPNIKLNIKLNHPSLLTWRERHLICLLLRGQTAGEAFALMPLTPDAGQGLLAGLMRRQQVTTPRQLLTRALVHRWVR